MFAVERAGCGRLRKRSSTAIGPSDGGVCQDGGNAVFRIIERKEERTASGGPKVLYFFRIMPATHRSVAAISLGGAPPA